MKKGLKLLLASVLAIGLFLASGCSEEQTEQKTVKAEAVEALNTEEWQWPENLHFSASGQSGLAKYLSWVAKLEEDTGTAIRIIPEDDPGTALQYLAKGDAVLSSASKNIISSVMEAKEDHATADGGPFQARIVWLHDLANAGFFVRGDSDIETIYDIGKGTRFSVWNMRPSTLNPYRSLLAWIQVNEEDIIFVDSGDFAGAMRAIAEGRADVAFGFPTSPQLLEVASAPSGLKFLALNADADPEGAVRWQNYDPLYSFAPMASGIQEAQGVWGSVGYIFDITGEDTDADLIYNLAKWLDENYDKYKDAYASNVYMTRDHLMEALKTTFIPVHEGLVRYLKEKNLWTSAHDKRQQENINLMNTYCNAYQDALQAARNKGVEISPTNQDWITLWETYKVEHRIPKMGMHVSLTESGAKVIPTEIPALEAPETTPVTPKKDDESKASIEGLSVEFISVTDPAKISTPIRVEIKATPGAECKLVMTLFGGTVSGFPKDPVKIADENGTVIWEWEHFSHTPAGETKLEVTAALDGKSVTATTYFITVQ